MSFHFDSSTTYLSKSYFLRKKSNCSSARSRFTDWNQVKAPFIKMYTVVRALCPWDTKLLLLLFWLSFTWRRLMKHISSFILNIRVCTRIFYAVLGVKNVAIKCNTKEFVLFSRDVRDVRSITPYSFFSVFLSSPVLNQINDSSFSFKREGGMKAA